MTTCPHCLQKLELLTLDQMEEIAVADRIRQNRENAVRKALRDNK